MGWYGWRDQGQPHEKAELSKIEKMFRDGKCSAPIVKCPETAFAFIVLNLGDSIAYGAYCPDHAQLITAMLAPLKDRSRA